MIRKPKNRFYNFLMLKVIPRVLKKWNKLDAVHGPGSNELDIKWHLDELEFYMWYKYALKVYWEKSDWIGVIICATILLFQKDQKEKMK